MQRSAVVAASSGPAWMLDLLYSSPTVAWAEAGRLPPGYDLTEQFAVLPSAPGRSFLVSLAGRRASASALTSYNALRFGRKRLVRGLLGLGLRARVVQPLLRTKIDIGVRAGTAPQQRTADLLADHLGEFLGTGPVVLAVGGGTGPYRKPVLQVFSVTGAPLAYVKVGWNGWTRDGVRREAQALRAYEGQPMHFGVPRLIQLLRWHGLELLVTAPLPAEIRGVGLQVPPPDAGLLREISRLTPGYSAALATSPWWRGVRTRIEACGPDQAARTSLQQASAQIAREYGQALLEFGFCHGDLVPWNLARLGEHLYVWDWESSAPEMPLGFDAVHYHFQVAFVGRGLPLAEATAIAARAARPALRELGVPAHSCSLVALLHLIEVFLRHEEARRDAGDADERFYPAVIDVLSQQLAATQVIGADMAGRVA